MLKKSRRMNSAEVQKVISRGRFVRGKLLSLKSLATEGASKVAVVVSRKTARLAVERNDLRRLIYRALVGHHAGTIDMVPGGMEKDRSLIVFVEKVPPGKDKRERERLLREELNTLLQSMKSH